MSDIGSLHVGESVLRTARDHPWRHAVIEQGEPIVYMDFARQVQAIGRVLASHPGETALILARKCSWCYATMVAALQWGVPYMTVDPDKAVQAQRAYESLGPSIIFGGLVDLERLSFGNSVLRKIDYESLRLVDTRRAPAGLSEETAYWMTTSGSTGEPKLIRLGRGGLANLLQWALDQDLVADCDRAAQYSRLTFDLSVLEVFAPLQSGATLVPASSPADVARPLRFMRRNHISWWCSVPTVADMLARDRPDEAYEVRSTFVFCGDQLMPRHLSSVWDRFPNARIVNTYGPTEATVLVSALEVPREFASLGAAIPIGTPINGVSLHFRSPEVADGSRTRNVEVGIEGEQVALEILQARNDRLDVVGPDMVSGSRLFWTGDAVRRTPEGLRFVHRIDRQVKLNGFRVELSAIDAAVQRIMGVPSFTLLHDGRILCALMENYVDVDALKERLKAEIPEYMMPTRFVHLGTIPTTLNGKVDWRRLQLLVEREEAQLKPAGGTE